MTIETTPKPATFFIRFHTFFYTTFFWLAVIFALMFCDQIRIVVPDHSFEAAITEANSTQPVASPAKPHNRHHRT